MAAAVVLAVDCHPRSKSLKSKSRRTPKTLRNSARVPRRKRRRNHLMAVAVAAHLMRIKGIDTDWNDPTSQNQCD